VEGDQSHRAWKWALAVICLGLLIFSLFLIAQGPEVSIFEERVPIIKYVTTTTHVTRQVPRSQILFSGTDLLISTWGYRYSGPYRIDVGKTLKVSWEADTSVNVYVMNDVDWRSRFFGAPTRWRSSKVGSSGTLEFYIQHDEPIYIQVLCPTWCSAKLYRWEEKVEWIENVVEVVTKTEPIQTEIIQTRTNLQTSRVTIGYLLAATSGVMIVISMVFILGPNIRFSRKVTYEESTRLLLDYQEYLQDLRRLMTQRDLLRAMYERGEINEDVYRKLESEISEEISSMKDIIDQERAACENELKSLEEKLIGLKRRLEELRVRKYLGIIEEKDFERETRLIMKDFESMKKRREYLKSLLEILKME